MNTEKWKSLPPGRYQIQSHRLHTVNLDLVLDGFRWRGYQVDSVIELGPDQYEVNLARRWDSKTMGRF